MKQTQWILLLAALATMNAHAQAAGPRINCTVSCLAVADPYPTAGPQPTSCKLYVNGTFRTAAPPVTTSTGAQCQIRTSYPVGNYSITMSAVDSAGQESPQSVPFVFESEVPLPAPANLRIAP